MVRPSYRSMSNVTRRSILPPCSIHGIRDNRQTSCDGLTRKKDRWKTIEKDYLRERVRDILRENDR